MKKSTWITPFKKQCFVTAGVSLNMASHGIVNGFSAVLLPQLRKHDSPIPIDDSSGSWIASILGFALVVGNFIVPSVMSRYGRRTANLTSIIPCITGWFCILLAESVTTLLIARFLQGVAMGMSASLCPVIIGEYTSPKNRGAFLTTIGLAMATGVLVVHSIGSFFSWQITALVCAYITFIDLLIVIHSPETPSWLSDQGRYEESKRVFRWLRGDEEEDELKSMIESSIMNRNVKMENIASETLMQRLKKNLAYIRETLKKKEFYKPIFIMIHIYTLGQWAGANILAAYTVDIFHNVVGPDANIPLLVITMDIQRIISNTCAVFVIKKVKRRTMLLSTISINISAFLMIAGYTYAKSAQILPFDSPIIGIILIHIHMFAIATGTVPLPFIIAGEVFPLQFRGLAGGISILFLSSNLFLTIKTMPFLFSTIGLSKAYILYAAIVSYCLGMAWIFLPETKDRTLQQIEEEFRGGHLSSKDIESTTSLTGQVYNCDRRCSSPVM